MTRIVFQDYFLLMGTNYHKQEAFAIADDLTDGKYYWGKSNKELKHYIQNARKEVYKYNNLITTDVVLQKEPHNKYDKYAVKVLYNNLFAGYLPSELTRQLSHYIENENYICKTTLKGWGGPYKTLSSDWEKVVTKRKELRYYLDLTIISLLPAQPTTTKSKKKKSFWARLFRLH